MSTEFLAIVSVCNIYLGWGYGYLLYGVMLIPIVYYFMYLDNGNVKSAVPHYIAFIDLFMITFTAMIGRDYNKIAWVGDNQVLGMLMGNTLFSIVALIFYSGRFITEIRHTTKHLAYRADYDMLTGVLNREGFNERAAKMLKNNPDTKYVMVCSDVKDFKMINDIYGDEVGDKVLIKEAELLKNIADGRTVYGRIGGDRFAICLPKELFKEEQFVENIVTMKKTFSTGYYQMFIYIGVYEITDNNEPVGVMYDKANMAIKCMKGNYQHAVAYYDRAILEEELEQKKLIAEFDKALITMNSVYSCSHRPMLTEPVTVQRHLCAGIILTGDFSIRQHLLTVMRNRVLYISLTLMCGSRR